jgi:eukaryotic-like serine/threonine-protein kinase
MTVCNRASCQQLLEGRLATDEESAFTEHLQHCSQCRAWLEEESGDAQLWRSARTLLISSAEIVHWSTSEAGSGIFAISPGSLPDERPDLAVDLSFLAPSDDPAYVGRIGPYQVTGVIGRGGMGIVLKAVDSSLSRNVAIKVLDPSLAGLGAARQRFAREARAMAAISHEHVLPIYAVDEQQRIPYFAMEYVAGGTLENRLRKDGPLDVVSAVRVALQIAQALAAAHGSGLVHRDIKPANILLDRGIERVRVADFGLARIANEASETRSGLVAGTPQYMSPEQVRGDSCDARSDLFSLGSVMYAMCAGHAPFRAETVYGAMQRIVHSEPRPLREQNPQAPAWLARFIEKLLAKDRADRFASAAEVAEILTRELASLQNPRANPVPSRLWMRRNGLRSIMRFARQRPFSASLAVIFTFTMAALAWQAWQTNTPHPGHSVSTASPLPSEARPVSNIPLWNADGLKETRERADRCEADLMRNADPLADPWSADLQRARQRLAEFSRNDF